MATNIMKRIKLNVSMLNTSIREWNNDHFTISSGIRNCVGEQVSGDKVLVHQTETYTLVGVIDGLGHGREAAEIASQIRDFCTEHADMELNQLIQSAHKNFLGSRGAVIALARISNQGIINFVGVGNIRARIVKPNEQVPLISKDGALGIRMRTLIVQQFAFDPGDRLVMYSDGISNRLIPELKITRLLNLKKFVTKAIQDYGKEQDDASIIYLVKNQTNA